MKKIILLIIGIVSIFTLNSFKSSTKKQSSSTSFKSSIIEEGYYYGHSI